MRVLRKNALMAIGAAAALLPQSHAGTFSANFNDNAAPAGTSVNGNTGDNNSGVIENGILKITKSVNSKTGGFVIDDLDAGAPVYGLTFTSKIRVGGGSGTPADGFSLNFAPDINMDATGGEEGIGSGITIAFDIFDNGNENPPAPSIDLKVGGRLVATAKKSFADMSTGADFADVSLTVTAGGAVTLVYKGETIFNNVYFEGYSPIVGGRFAIVGRTGGLNDNFWFDDISLSTITTPQVGIAVNPASQTVVIGTAVTFAPVVNNTDGATFQWLKNGSPLTGETNPTLTLASAATTDSGAKYSLQITGPNNTVTTTQATLTVIDLPLPAPTATFDFTSVDGSAPVGTTIIPGAAGGYITYEGDGTGFEPGVLHLTDNQNDERAVLIVDDLVAGAPVYGISARFKLLIGGGTTPPADGFSFNFANDIPDSADGNLEDGIGTGLTVGFDIFDNGGGEGPSIDVRYGGVLVAQQKVAQSFIETGDQFADVIIRLENDGTIDVVYKGVVIFNNLTVPGFSQITGGRVALAGRTGGLNANIWVDDLSISEATTPGDLRITTQPLNQYVLNGATVTLSGAVNDATGVTYQWLKNGAPIAGATEATYSFTAGAADTGAQYSLKVTRGGLTATSNPATLTVLAINPTLSLNFDSGTATPAGTVLVGTAGGSAGYISADGGVDNSGVVHLTDAVNSQAGAFVIEPLLSGAEVAAINVAFDIRLGGGTANAADGTSFNWAADLPETTLSGAEEGTGAGLTVTFDIYDNGGGEAPSVDLKWKGVTISQTKMTKAEIQTDAADGTPAFRKVLVKVTADGKVDLVYGNRILAQNLQITNYAPIANSKFGWYARTGGENENQWIDNIQIQAIKSTAPLRITAEPTDIVLSVGQTATFTVGVSDPTGVTFQWSKNGTPIPGATGVTYTTPALTAGDANATFSVTATGPGGVVTSRSAVVIPPITVATPDIAFSFDGSDPVTGILVSGTGGGGTIDGGGVNGTSALHLTDDAGGQGGSFYIPDFDNGQTVSAFTATFKLLLRSAGTPADGVSFVWANDVTADTVFGEDGAGSGLVISFDTYDNGGGEAPAIDLLYQGVQIADVKMPIGSLLTGDNFVDVGIRVESDGTVDVQYNGKQIFNNVKIPNFTPMAGGFFALGGRTGGSSEDAWVDDIKIVTSSSVAGPSVNVARNTDGSLNISWTGGGKLQATSDLGSNSWTDVTTTSPATVSTTGTMRFFRVAQ